jgi:LacI family repressor for deo operon, udp, cdd, tsx, nupC, and nupG
VAITIKDVADAAGVSTATVSRALRGLPNVDSATRDRIQRIATELDYVISPSASRLASGRTGSIAVITPYIARWYFSTVLSGVESVLQNAGMDLLLMSVSTPDGQHRLPPAPRLRRRVDGVLVIALPPQDAQLHEVLGLHMPTSLIGLTMPAVPSVTIDDVLAGQIATQHLINLGHERIGVINGAPIISPYTAENDRYRGFENAMKDAGLPIDPMLEAYGYFTIPGGEQAMTALLTQKTPPTAVFAMSDEMAFGAMKAMRSHGLQPGKDISLVGVDGHDMSEFLDLTTVVQPVQDLGRIAAEALVLQLRSPGAEVSTDSIRLPTQLIVRGSTSPFKG